MKRTIIIAAVFSAAISLGSCRKDVPFSYDTVDEVDLGLSVIWAGRNYGADESVGNGTATRFDTDPFAGGWELAGEGWRMPTLGEWEELNSCKSEIVRVGSRKALCFTGKNGNKLILPFAGVVAGDPSTMHDLCDNVWMRYWSSASWDTDPAYAVTMSSRGGPELLPEPHLKGVPASLRLVRPSSPASAGL